MTRAAPLLGLAWLLLACGGASTPRTEAPKPNAAPSWGALADALPGHWVASLDGHVIEVHYGLTSRQTVLLETWMPRTAAETVSAMHLDGEHLMLTHYCGQGNQPRLRLVEHGDVGYVFAQYDATDLAPDEASMSRLTLSLHDDVLERVETYVREGVSETTTLTFRRRGRL